ncbi:hypothetical protein C475_11875 [Halosimplex carlsbadense 2-9-1]|uniref:Uncharacterized protein n=1 Tax=Halosimplex carlsbadense 2-9-1 TaxID=797114 RepID=M0CSU1_9EURY|nr:hypothetical protein [Halosimplex carlsbadense]ELZ24934.1 hypothetical protein C475_11875 [Halosimplex carlsbadense 2-9-1]
MVDPISAEERSAFNRRVVYGSTLLVGLSAGLITLQIEATAAQTAGSVVLGLLVGYPLAKYVVPTGPAPADRQRERLDRENPFTDGGAGDSDGPDGGGDRGSTDAEGEDDSRRTRSRSDDYGRR